MVGSWASSASNWIEIGTSLKKPIYETIANNYLRGDGITIIG